MPSNLPKTYKVGVFNEANKPLSFEERELKLPQEGEVSLVGHLEVSIDSERSFSRF